MMKIVGFDDSTSFIDHVYWGSTESDCKSNETPIEQYKKMFESRISDGTNTCMGKTLRTKVAWSYDVEGHVRKCVERCYELTNKILELLYKVSGLCLYDHQFK